MGLIYRLRRSLAEDGIVRTARKALVYAYHDIMRYLTRRRLRGAEPDAVFADIYRNNAWRDAESSSGPGSTLSYTKNLRERLPALVRDYGIRVFFDAPCGDFNWMRHVDFGESVTYIGADIVPGIVRANNERFARAGRSFIVADIIRDPFPDADLWFCRDCLFHLSYRDTFRALRNFANSNVRFLLTSTHLNDGGFSNVDILTGDFRLVDLFSAPFGFPRDVGLRIVDYVTPFPPREMCLWTRDQIVGALPAMAAAAHLGDMSNGPERRGTTETGGAGPGGPSSGSGNPVEAR